MHRIRQQVAGHGAGRSPCRHEHQRAYHHEAQLLASVITPASPRRIALLAALGITRAQVFELVAEANQTEMPAAALGSLATAMETVSYTHLTLQTIYSV